MSNYHTVQWTVWKKINCLSQKKYFKNSSVYLVKPLLSQNLLKKVFSNFHTVLCSVEKREIHYHENNFVQSTHFNDNTVWKFVDFSVTQILCETNLREFTYFAILGALNSVHLVNFSLQKLQKCIKIKIQSL